MRMATINGQRVPLCGDQFTDAQIAGKVRMLYRDQIDHEAVCTMARDRIVWLAEQNAALLAALDGLVNNGFTVEELARRWSWSADAIKEARAAFTDATAQVQS